MAQSLEELASVVEALQRRVEALETALKGMDLPVGGGPQAPLLQARTTPHVDFDVRLARMRALDEYYRRDRVQFMAAHPELRAAMRDQRAKVNAYLEERGLPPDPDPYHELP